MKTYTKTEINSIVQCFNDKTLPISEWTHEAHIIMAIWHNLSDHFPVALKTIKYKIIAYNNSVGTLNTEKSGYHQTLTVFWMMLTKNFILHNPHLDITEAINMFLNSNESEQGIVFQYYSSHVLFSKEARRNWVNGDLKEINLKLDKMNNHFDWTDSEFKSKMEYCSLPSNLFNHEAHLRLAWINIKDHGLDDAIEIICNQITKYVGHLGAFDKFNKTLTIAATKAVNHFMEKSKSDNFMDFIQEFPRLKTNFKDLMAAHYGFDIYNSEVAKAQYLEPDLLPF